MTRLAYADFAEVKRISLRGNQELTSPDRAIAAQYYTLLGNGHILLRHADYRDRDDP